VLRAPISAAAPQASPPAPPFKRWPHIMPSGSGFCLRREALWDWLPEQTPATLSNLLAYCAASTVTAIRKPQDRADARPLLHADWLAEALSLDMAQ
jgi:hypothetical protein